MCIRDKNDFDLIVGTFLYYLVEPILLIEPKVQIQLLKYKYKNREFDSPWLGSGIRVYCMAEKLHQKLLKTF